MWDAGCELHPAPRRPNNETAALPHSDQEVWLGRISCIAGRTVSNILGEHGGVKLQTLTGRMPSPSREILCVSINAQMSLNRRDPFHT